MQPPRGRLGPIVVVHQRRGRLDPHAAAAQRPAERLGRLAADIVIKGGDEARAGDARTRRGAVGDAAREVRPGPR